MAVIDQLVKANKNYAKDFKLGGLPMPPGQKIAIVACMDARMTIEPMLGLKTGDAHIIRNAGGIVTEDEIRSLLISHYLLGTKEFMVINHTDCGMLKFKDKDLISKLQKVSKTTPVSPTQFHSFKSLKVNIKEQIQKIKSHPWIPKNIPVRGFIFDVKTGKISEVK